MLEPVRIRQDVGPRTCFTNSMVFHRYLVYFIIAERRIKNSNCYRYSGFKMLWNTFWGVYLLTKFMSLWIYAKFNPLSANLTKWSDTLKQFVGVPLNHFVGLALKRLNTFIVDFQSICRLGVVKRSCCNKLFKSFWWQVLCCVYKSFSK